MATSVWMNGMRFSCGRSRPLALTMPAVIVFSSPKACRSPPPIADLELLRVADHHRQVPGVDLEQCHVGALVGPDHLGLELALVGEVTLTSSAPSTTCALVTM